MIGFIKGLFGADKVIDSGLRIIEHLTGADDMTGKEKASFIIQWQKATAHQSQSRRFMAICVMLVWITLIASWLIVSALNAWLSTDELRMFANNIKMLMGDLVIEPFNLVIAFYFVIHGVTQFAKK